MNGKTTALILLILTGSAAVAFSSNIDPVSKFSWSENAGWMNWRDANAALDGVLLDTNDNYLSGYIWMESAGWLDVGDGSPADGVAYENADDTDFGVNIDPGTGDLYGFAWAENIGWVNFDTAANAPNQARYDASTKRLRGYAWAENIGWINLDDSTHFVAVGSVLPPTVAPVPHDRRKNRYISFTPGNGSNVVAFRVTKTSAPSGSCWVQIPVQAAGNTQYTATCGNAPVFRVWDEPVVHVGDCEIIPVADYAIDATDGLTFSSTLAVGTILLPSGNSKLWGDTVGIHGGFEWTPPNQFTNVQDVLAIQALISGAAVRPHFTVANLQSISAADSCLNAQVNTSDVLIAVRAIAGDSYGPPSTPKLIDPADCAAAPSMSCPCCGN